MSNPHEALKATYQPGQRWETRIVMDSKGPIIDAPWHPIYPTQTPQWDAWQEYRRVDDGTKS